jgi:hypothetical protein
VVSPDTGKHRLAIDDRQGAQLAGPRRLDRRDRGHMALDPPRRASARAPMLPTIGAVLACGRPLARTPLSAIFAVEASLE